MQGKPPSIGEVIQHVLKKAQGPISVDELIEQVLAIRGSKAKNPRQSILTQVRYEEGDLMVKLGHDQVISMPLAMNGARFRIRLDEDSVKQAGLPLQPILRAYLPRGFPLDQVRLVDENDRSVRAHTRVLTQKAVSPLGFEYEMSLPFTTIKEWFRSNQVDTEDHLLFTIVDWERGEVRLVREPASRINPLQISQRNSLLADLLYQHLENATYEDDYISSALPSAYAHLPEKDGLPPDHFMTIVEEDGRMFTDGISLKYYDDVADLFDLYGEEKEQTQPELSETEKQTVYRFRAAFKKRKGLWREIEILGGQTLAEFDSILRDAFQHGTWDHLSGFWKLIPRRGGGKKTRYREVDLGRVNPFEPSEGQNLPVGAIGLSAGDRLKYVYDFGDWVEHEITLEAVEAMQPGVEYPRINARSQVRARYCVECKGKGKKARAVWVCLECSSLEDAWIWLCEACAERHETHYVEEILY